LDQSEDNKDRILAEFGKNSAWGTLRSYAPLPHLNVLEEGKNAVRWRPSYNTPFLTLKANPCPSTKTPRKSNLLLPSLEG